MNTIINTRLTEFCRILFGFSDNMFTVDEYDITDERWGSSPKNIIDYVGDKFMTDIQQNLIKSFDIESWKKHIDTPYTNLHFDSGANNESNYTDNINVQFIGVTGKKFNGKDTISDYICGKYNFKKVAYATPLKDACRVLFDFSEEQLYGNLKETYDDRWGIAPRQAYQHIGTNLFRNQLHNLLPKVGNNFWVKCLEEMVKKIVADDPKTRIIVSDIRFQNEVDSLKNLFTNCKIIRVKRPYMISNDTHDSEKFIDDLKYIDCEIENNGTLESLYNKIDMQLCL